MCFFRTSFKLDLKHISYTPKYVLKSSKKFEYSRDFIKRKNSLILHVVGGSSLVRKIGVVHPPGVEPLELPVLIVGHQLGGILLLTPVHISSLAGQSAMSVRC